MLKVIYSLFYVKYSDRCDLKLCQCFYFEDYYNPEKKPDLLFLILVYKFTFIGLQNYIYTE